METSIISDLEAKVEGLKRNPQVLSVIMWPDPRLKTVSKPVVGDIKDPEFQAFLDDMVLTMRQYRGIGLAAIQVGVATRALVVQDDKGVAYKIVNPRLLESEGSVMMNEGCLSLPGFFIQVRRPAEITLEYIDGDTGERKTVMSDKWLARAILHEMDHLDGLVIFDAVPQVLRSAVVRKYQMSIDAREAMMKKVVKMQAGDGQKYKKKSREERRREKQKRKAGKA